eukprot:6997634-Pyramimonas_sp.AAC.1
MHALNARVETYGRPGHARNAAPPPRASRPFHCSAMSSISARGLASSRRARMLPMTLHRATLSTMVARARAQPMP